MFGGDLRKNNPKEQKIAIPRSPHLTLLQRGETASKDPHTERQILRQAKNKAQVAGESGKD